MGPGGWRRGCRGRGSVEWEAAVLDDRPQNETRLDASDAWQLGQHLAVQPFEVGRDSITAISPVYKDRGNFEFTGAIEKIVDEVIAENPDNVAAYKGGKDKLFGFFVGQVMKKSAGKANPDMVNDLLKAKLV